MKKRIVLLLCAMLLICLTAAAESTVPILSKELYGQAKEALSRLSYGEYDQISSLLSFDEDAPEASDWEALAKKFKTLDDGTVQREISVAYWKDKAWNIAVPVKEPKNGKVEALILITEDGKVFSDYAYAQWSAVKSNYEASDYISWNEEYVESVPIVVSDD